MKPKKVIYYGKEDPPSTYFDKNLTTQQDKKRKKRFLDQYDDSDQGQDDEVEELSEFSFIDEDAMDKNFIKPLVRDAKPH